MSSHCSFSVRVVSYPVLALLAVVATLVEVGIGGDLVVVLVPVVPRCLIGNPTFFSFRDSAQIP